MLNLGMGGGQHEYRTTLVLPQQVHGTDLTDFPEEALPSLSTGWGKQEEKREGKLGLVRIKNKGEKRKKLLVPYLIFIFT